MTLVLKPVRVIGDTVMTLEQIRKADYVYIQLRRLKKRQTTTHVLNGNKVSRDE